MGLEYPSGGLVLPEGYFAKINENVSDMAKEC